MPFNGGKAVDTCVRDPLARVTGGGSEATDGGEVTCFVVETGGHRGDGRIQERPQQDGGGKAADEKACGWTVGAAWKAGGDQNG